MAPARVAPARVASTPPHVAYSGIAHLVCDGPAKPPRPPRTLARLCRPSLFEEVLSSCRAGFQVPYGPQMLEGPCQSSLCFHCQGFPLISSRPRHPARVAPTKVDVNIEKKRCFFPLNLALPLPGLPVLGLPPQGLPPQGLPPQGLPLNCPSYIARLPPPRPAMFAPHQVAPVGPCATPVGRSGPRRATPA